MSDIETPEYDIDHESYAERGESYVAMRHPVEVHRRVETNWTQRYDDDLKEYGDDYTDLRSEQVFYEHKRFGNSLVNLDSYFRPDHTADHSIGTEVRLDTEDGGYSHGGRWYKADPGQVRVQRLGPPTYRFTLYEHELVEAAKQRANEDFSHHVRVLAGWLSWALPVDDAHYTQACVSPLRAALRDEAEKYPDLDWAVQYAGEPNLNFSAPRPIGLYPESNIHEDEIGDALYVLVRSGHEAASKEYDYEDESDFPNDA